MDVRRSFQVLDGLKYLSILVAIPLTVWLANQFGWPLWLAIILGLAPIPVAVYLVLSTAASVVIIPLLRRSAARGSTNEPTTMDPAMPPEERLASLRPRDKWMIQNLARPQDPQNLKLFAESVLSFVERHARGYSTKEFADEVVLPFAQGIAGKEYRRLGGQGVDEATATTRARDYSAKVTKEFFSTGSNPDGTWKIIKPDTTTHAG